MPGRKRFVLSTTVRWSEFDIALFRYLATLTRNGMADEMRTALRFYARHVPGFDAKKFEAFVRRERLSQIEDSKSRDQLRAEVAAYVQSVDSIPEGEALDGTTGGVGGARGRLASSGDDFDIGTDF